MFSGPAEQTPATWLIVSDYVGSVRSAPSVRVSVAKGRVIEGSSRQRFGTTSVPSPSVSPLVSKVAVVACAVSVVPSAKVGVVRSLETSGTRIVMG